MSLLPFEIVSGSTENASRPDTIRFLKDLAALSTKDVQPSEERREAQSIFQWGEPWIVSRAPGRLDVMGGIADYSGSLVLQMPIAEACHVALQRQRQVQDGGKHERATGCISIVAFNADPLHRSPLFKAPLEDIFPGGSPLDYVAARSYFKREDKTSWAAYVAGCLLVLFKEQGIELDIKESLAIIVSSDVPEGKGVSSSASVEVATMMALLAAFNLQERLDGRQVAILCQKVENLVVGAPCGIMDQMASTLGEEGKLLALLCQPAEVQSSVEVPGHLRFWGIDSGIRHSVGGSDYGSVRVGAFMGLKIAMEVESGFSRDLKGYLANLEPSEYVSYIQKHLPETLSGSEFHSKYGNHLDTVTTIDENKCYAIQVASDHPIFDHFRVRNFRQMLITPSSGKESANDQLCILGELMFQTHASYSACGLGSVETDRLVQLVREEMAAARQQGQQPTVYGAKITGGGSGGTVCILGTSESSSTIQKIVKKFEAEIGDRAHVFEGSSLGAWQFGTLVCRCLDS